MNSNVDIYGQETASLYFASVCSSGHGDDSLPYRGVTRLDGRVLAFGAFCLGCEEQGVCSVPPSWFSLPGCPRVLPSRPMILLSTD